MVLLVSLAQAASGVIAAFLAGALVGALFLYVRRPASEEGVPAQAAPVTGVEAITKAQQTQQRVLDAVADAVVGVDAQGRVEFTNIAAGTLFGWGPREFLGSRFDHLVLDDAGAGALASTLSEGEGHALDVARVRRKDGSHTEASVTINPTRHRGKVTGAVLALRDLTQAREQEAKLRQSEAHLREAQAVANMGSWEYNVKTGIVSATDSLFKLSGVEPSKSLDLDAAMQTVHPDDREHLERTIQSSLESGEPYVVEHRVLRPDGEQIRLRARGRVVREDGVPARIVGTAEDITEAHRIHAELEARESLFRHIAEATTDYVSIIDSNGAFLYNNRLFETYAAEQVLGHPAWDFVPDEHKDAWKEALIAAVAAEGPGQVELPGVDADGKKCMWHVEVRPYKEQDATRAVLVSRMVG